MIPSRSVAWLFTAMSSVLACGGQVCVCEDCVEVLPAELGLGEAAAGEALCVLGDLHVDGEIGPELERVQEIQGSLILDGNTELRRFDVWDRLERAGAIIVSRNPNLERIAGGRGLVAIAHDLYIVDNPKLLDVELSPERMDPLGSIYITHNPSVASIGLGSIEEVDDEVLLVGNDRLATFDARRVRSIGGDLSITESPALEELLLGDLQDVGGTLTISGTESLEAVDLPDLEGCVMLILLENTALRTFSSRVSPQCSISVRSNPALSVFRAGAMTTVEGGFAVFVDNSSLAVIEGFTEAEVLLGLWVMRNSSLSSLSWPRLRELGGLGLIIGANESLEGEPAAFLPALQRSPSVAIYGNSSLSPETVAALVERVDVDDPSKIKTGNNYGEDVTLAPCPWENDVFCDQELSACGRPGTGLCAEDEADCACRD